MNAGPDLATRMMRFTVSGLSATSVHGAAAWLLIQAGAGAAWGNGLATVIAAVASYLMHTLWSFEAKIAAANAARFVFVVAFCSLVAATTGRLAEAALGSAELSIFAVMAVVPPLSFVLHNFWTYRR